MDHLRVYGSKAFVHVRDDERRKWDPKARETILVGYEGTHAYRLWDKNSRKLTISRDVKIVEPKVTVDIEWYEKDSTANDDSDSDAFEEASSGDGDYQDVTDQEVFPPDDEPGSNQEEELNDDQDDQEEEIPSSPVTVDQPDQSIPIIDDDDEEEQGTSRRKLREKPRRWYGEARPYVKKSVPEASSAFMFMVTDEPINYKQAMKSDENENWRKAAEEEFRALIKNDTWTLVKRTPDMNVVSSKWIFRKKLKADGSVERHKARLVARGFTQQEGIDYDETFSPVVRYDTVRTLLAHACDRGWDLYQFDIKTAFLNGDLEETIYMEEPEGYKTSDGSMVCKLKKSLYGLKQAPRCWAHKVEVGLGAIWTQTFLK